MIGKGLGRIRLDYLNTFLVLVRNKNFSETAKVLNITQGTVSQHLKELEDAFGCLLIDRTSKKFEITPFGILLEQSASTIADEIQKVNLSIEKESGNLKLKIKIASSSIPGEYVLPKFFTDFQRTHGNFEFQIDITNSQDSLEKLIKKNVLFAAVGGLFNEEKEKFHAKKIGSDKIVIICRKSHPIISELRNTREEQITESVFKILLKYPWIFREKGSATRDLFFEKMPFAGEIKSNLEFQSNLAIIQAIENSNSLSSLSNFTYDKYKNDSNISIVKHSLIPKIRRDFYFLKLKDTSLKELELELWDSIQNI